MRLHGLGFRLAVSILILAGHAYADVPARLNHQGLLLNQSGQPINGSQNLVLRVWNHATSTAPANLLYQENQNAVTVVDGVYSVTLGAGTSPSGPFSASLFSLPDTWLEVVVNGETMAPRQKLMAVAYSLQAQQCVNAGTVQGSTLAQIVSQAQTNVPAASITGQIADSQVSASFTRDAEMLPLLLTIDGTGSSLDADRLDGIDSSGFTQLGQSIEGGEITDGTIGPDDLASFSVTQPKIAPSSIYDAAINLDAFISGTKINPRFGSQNIQTDGWIGTDTPEHATELRAGNQVALRLIPHAGFGQAGVSVVAGINNFVTANQFGETVGGGQQNSVYDDYGTVAGGYRNAAGANDGTENNDFATVGGGDLDEAFGQYSTVPGGLRNIAGGPFSFAAGRRAIVRVPVQSGDFDGDEGTFVWADSQDVDFLSSGPNQFLIRAAGGVGIGTNTPQGVLQLGSSSDAAAVRFGNASSRHHMISNRDFVLNAFDTDGALNGSALFIFRRNTTKFDESGFANLAVLSDGGDLTIFGATATKPGGGAWTVASDERLKKNIHPLDHALDSLLELHGITFEYKDPEAIHELHGERIGMTAQNVETVFPDWVSEGKDGYKRVTYRGFEALTVEALRELTTREATESAELRKQSSELAALRDENRALREESRAVEARLEHLEVATGVAAAR